MNRLTEREQRVRNRASYALNQQWYDLLDEWAALNGIRTCNQHFGLKRLAERRGINSRYDHSDHWWPARDHYSYYHIKQRAAAIVTEPYLCNEIGELRCVVRDHGLVLHTPANPTASFWYPGWTVFCVITRSDFGAVRWLPDQVDFTGGFDHKETLIKVGLLS